MAERSDFTPSGDGLMQMRFTSALWRITFQPDEDPVTDQCPRFCESHQPITVSIASDRISTSTRHRSSHHSSSLSLPGSSTLAVPILAATSSSLAGNHECESAKVMRDLPLAIFTNGDGESMANSVTDQPSSAR